MNLKAYTSQITSKKSKKCIKTAGRDFFILKRPLSMQDSIKETLFLSSKIRRCECMHVRARAHTHTHPHTHTHFSVSGFQALMQSLLLGCVLDLLIHFF